MKYLNPCFKTIISLCGKKTPFNTRWFKPCPNFIPDRWRSRFLNPLKGSRELTIPKGSRLESPGNSFCFIFINGCFSWMIPNHYIHKRWWFHQTSIKAWLFRVPGNNSFLTSMGKVIGKVGDVSPPRMLFWAKLRVLKTSTDLFPKANFFSKIDWLIRGMITGPSLKRSKT